MEEAAGRPVLWRELLWLGPEQNTGEVHGLSIVEAGP